MENIQIGSYRILNRLGRGGFAEVYLGEHIHLGMQAAIKVLPKDIVLTEEDVLEFKKEARVIARLRHPHIVHILDFGIENESPYLVMDLAANGTLRQRHPKGSIVPLASVVSYVREIAGALQYVHNQKIIHRDVKPENILIDEHGTILLSDFGIASIAHSTISAKVENAIGTATYMAPEQFVGKPCAASDQYALGVIVYEWLCGKPPFTGNTQQLAWQHWNEPPQLLSEKLPHISSTVVQVVMRSLAKEPERRYESIAAFAEALEAASKISRPETVTDTLLIRRCRVCGQKLEGQESFCSVCGAFEAQEYAQHTTMEAAGKPPPDVAGEKGLSTQQLPVTTGGQSIPEKLSLINPDGYDGVISVSWSPDGRYIATSLTGKRPDQHAILVWEACTGRKVLLFPIEERGGIDWSPDGRYITAKSQSVLRVLDTQTGRSVYEFARVDCQEDIIWSPDGKHCAVLTKSVLRVLDTQTGRSVYEFAEAYSRGGVAWSPDGRYIAYTETGKGENRRLVVRNPRSGHLVHDVSGLTYDPMSLQWSQDGRYITLHSSQKNVDIYDTQTGEWKQVDLPEGKLWYSHWSSNGRYITTTSSGKTVGKVIGNLFIMLCAVGVTFVIAIIVLFVIESIISESVYCSGYCTSPYIPPLIIPIPAWLQSLTVSLVIGVIVYLFSAIDMYRPEFFLTDVFVKKKITKYQPSKGILFANYRKMFHLSQDGKYVIYTCPRGWLKRTISLTVIGNEDLRDVTLNLPAINPDNIHPAISADGKHIAIVAGTSTEIRLLRSS